jgi:hypothetical protein
MRGRLSVLVAFLLVLLLLTGAWFFTNISSHERVPITAPADYAVYLQAFPPEMRAVVPGSIPASAASITGMFNRASGLGPSSSWLEVRFTVAPTAAGEILDACKAQSRSTNRFDGRVESVDALEFRQGDQSSSIRIDRSTGGVIIQLFNN